MMDVLTWHIQDRVSWCMLFVDDIVVIDKTHSETHSGVNARLEVQRQTLKSKGFRLSMTKTECLECKFSDATHEIGVEVRLDTHVIPKRRCFKCMGSLIQASVEINDDITHCIGVGWAK
ncbi:hypothetical protein R3W88_003376 [Solanum pinnatisectum]|uniref:Reverse transcriptase domain-containing protein n=1 Tax=Solanum pinnatisectum TaxID=50273 RepID=A0AAV9MRI1_9SOLN|nr:hypothetical protein R3W88_003376 [Solanum pinnatisectum]